MQLLRHNSKAQAGFTLLETLVAFALMALSIALIYRTSISSMGGFVRQAQLYELTEFARSQLDELVELGVTGPQKGTYADTWNWQTTQMPVSELPASYLDTSHIVLQTTITVTPSGQLAPKVVLSVEDFRQRP